MDHLLRREWNNPDLLTSNLGDVKQTPLQLP